MHGYTKLSNIRQLKSKKDETYQAQIDIQKLLKSVQNQDTKYKDKKLAISQNEFITLCRMGRNSLLRQPSLLRLQGPIVIATGTVGYYRDLATIVSRCGHPDKTNYLFIGDYIGKGDRNIECLVLLICLKLKLQNNFFMLRGCYDCIAMARSYNFYDECLDRFSSKAWAEACQFLCSLPFAAIIENQIFCCHGGISPQLKSFQDINRITRPIDTPQIGLVCDIVWGEPSFKEDSLIWATSERGFSFAFHEKVIQQFLKQNKLSLFIRGHDVIYDGFHINREKTLGTICSLANYGGVFNNSAAVFVLNAQFQAFFKIIKERQYFPIQSFLSQSSTAMLKKVIKQKKENKRKSEEQKIKMQNNQRRTQNSNSQNKQGEDYDKYINQENVMKKKLSFEQKNYRKNQQDPQNQHLNYNVSKEQFEKMKILMGYSTQEKNKKITIIHQNQDQSSDTNSDQQRL